MAEKFKFRDIHLDDKSLVERFTMSENINICDFAFSNLFGWAPTYQTNICNVNDSLIIRFNRNSHNYPLYLPILSTSDEKKYKTIEDLMYICQENKYPLTFMCTTPSFREFLDIHFPDKFDFFENRDGCDYVYTREKLLTLSGKKLQSKRNHINKFEKLYPDYTVRVISNDIVDDCLRIEEEWLDDHDQSNGRISEKTMINRIIRNKDSLGLLGVAIEVNGSVIAFSLGSPINHDTFGVHVEKANINYEGAFSIINREFVKFIPNKYKFINREEDMGIEGLRKAKLSYKPDTLLCKKTAIIR